MLLTKVEPNMIFARSDDSLRWRNLFLVTRGRKAPESRFRGFASVFCYYYFLCFFVFWISCPVTKSKLESNEAEISSWSCRSNQINLLRDLWLTVLSGLLYTIALAAYRTHTHRYCYSEDWRAGTTPKLLSESGVFFRTIRCSNCLAKQKLLSNILSNSYEIFETETTWYRSMQIAITDLKSKPCGDKSLFNNVNKPEEEK